MTNKNILFLLPLMSILMLPAVYARDSIFQLFTNLFDGIPGPVTGKIILFFIVFFIFWLIANSVHKSQGRERSIVAIIALLLAFISTIAIPNEIVSTIMQEYSFIIAFIFMLFPIVIVIGLFVVMHTLHKRMGHSRASAMAGLFIALVSLVLTTMISNSITGLSAIQNIEWLGWAVSIMDIIIIFLVLYMVYFAIQLFTGPRDPNSPMLKPMGESPIVKAFQKGFGKEAQSERKLNSLVNHERKQTLTAIQDEIKELEDIQKLKGYLSMLYVNLNPDNREFWSRSGDIESFTKFVNSLEQHSMGLIAELKKLERDIDTHIALLENEVKSRNLRLDMNAKNELRKQINNIEHTVLLVDEKRQIRQYLDNLFNEMNKDINDEKGIIKRLDALHSLSNAIKSELNGKIISPLELIFKKILQTLRNARSHAGNYDAFKQAIGQIRSDLEVLRHVESEISEKLLQEILERKRETEEVLQHLQHAKYDLIHLLGNIQANRDKILHIVNHH